MMVDNWLKKWDDKFREKGFAYGVEPNEYLKQELQKLQPGKILFAAEGEGRNAVYAAQKAWQVLAFDISLEGKKKALQLAIEKKVIIDYQVGLLPSLNYPSESFDAIALIYAHFPADIKSKYHRLLIEKLRKGGVVIFEAFGKNHLQYQAKNPKVGGPPDLDSLFSTEEIKADFKDFEYIELIEKEVELKEGLYHNGLASVVRFVGRKK